MCLFMTNTWIIVSTLVLKLFCFHESSNLNAYLDLNIADMELAF